MRILRFLPVALLLLGTQAVFADLIDKVPKDSMADLKDGEVVVKSKTLPGKPWPELILYQIVNASPKVIADLFSDYAAAPSYIPGMLAAKVVDTNPGGVTDVQYTVKVPVLQRISYTVRNTFTKSGNNYQVVWSLLKSPLAKSSDGSLQVEPYGNGQSLMCYKNVVVPITTLVSSLQSQALSEAKSTVEAIKNEAERRAAANPSKS